MSNIWLVTSAGIKNSLRMKIVLTILILVTLICVGGVMLILCLLLIKPEMESGAPNTAALKEHLSLALYSSSFIGIGVTLNSMMFQTMVKEKARGVLAALLATPLRASDIWVGKSLALFVPGLVLSIIMTVLSLVIINVVYFLPNIGFLASPQMIVTSLVAVPLVYLSFGMLVHLVGLISRPATGNVIAQIFLPVVINLMVQLCIRGVMGADSWQFMVLNLGVALAIGVVVLAVSPRLTAERVVLSG
jgi:ABC-2 type transport system permease protein